MMGQWRVGGDSLVELGRADDGDCLRQHHLVGAVCVEVDAGQKGRLGGVGLGKKGKKMKRTTPQRDAILCPKDDLLTTLSFMVQVLCLNVHEHK